MYYAVSKLKKIQKENLDMAKETQKEKMNRQLRNANAELQEKYDAAVTSYNAIRSDFEILSIESKAKGEETLKNTRGAGRKTALSKEAQEEVRDMHKLGMSYREIAKKIGVSFSVVARACQSKDDDKN